MLLQAETRVRCLLQVLRLLVEELCCNVLLTRRMLGLLFYQIILVHRGLLKDRGLDGQLKDH